MVLTNLGDALPSLLVQGIAEIVDPTLARDLTPIPDTEPEVTARLRELLASPQKAEAHPRDLPAGFSPFFLGDMQEYKESGSMLRQLGSPDRLDLVARREFGDDVVYLYLVRYPRQVPEVAFGLAPDEKVSHFSLRPTERK